MMGHAIWNGTAVGVPWVAFSVTGSEGVSIIATLVSTILLVIAVLGLGNLLPNGVLEEENLPQY